MPERLALADPFKQIPEVVGSGPFRYRAEERIQGSLVVSEDRAFRSRRMARYYR
jgi:peptide/nickel transport system substrate-binding protein